MKIQAEDIPGMIKKLNALKEKKAKHDGALEQLYKDLKDKFGFSTFKDAEAGLQKIDKEIEEEDHKFNGLLEEIELAIDWDKI